MKVPQSAASAFTFTWHEQAEPENCTATMWLLTASRHSWFRSSDAWWWHLWLFHHCLPFWKCAGWLRPRLAGGALCCFLLFTMIFLCIQATCSSSLQVICCLFHAVVAVSCITTSHPRPNMLTFAFTQTPLRPHLPQKAEYWRGHSDPRAGSVPYNRNSRMTEQKPPPTGSVQGTLDSGASSS